MNSIAETHPSPWESSRSRLALVITLTVVGMMVVYDNYRHLREEWGPKNLHALQAAAFLRGEIAVDRRLHDTVVLNGKYYSHFPPFPAIVLLPFVAIFGVDACNVFAVKVLLTALNGFLVCGILRRVGVEGERVGWLTIGFLAGTGYWFVFIAEGVWYFSQVVAVACLLLALWEALGRCRGVLVGFALGCAVLSRQITIYASVALAAMIWTNCTSTSRSRRLLNLVGFSTSLSILLAIYPIFNYIRFGDPFESGYRFLEVGPEWTANTARYGLFNIAYIPFNLMEMFVQGFHFDMHPNQLQLDRNGTSLTFASPFVFLAFAGRWHKPLTKFVWLSVALALSHLMMYYSDGFRQLNCQRYTLDFLPVLLPLIGIGMARIPSAIWKSLILYSVALNFVGLIVLPRAWSLLTNQVSIPIGP